MTQKPTRHCLDMTPAHSRQNTVAMTHAHLWRTSQTPRTHTPAPAGPRTHAPQQRATSYITRTPRLTRTPRTTCTSPLVPQRPAPPSRIPEGPSLATPGCPAPSATPHILDGPHRPPQTALYAVPRAPRQHLT